MSAIYQEGHGSTFSVDGRTFRLNEILKRAHDLPVVKTAVKDLLWHMEYVKTSKSDIVRVNNADLTAPLLLTKHYDKIMIIDGMHRLQKAVIKQVHELPSKYISEEMMIECLISKKDNLPLWRKW